MENPLDLRAVVGDLPGGADLAAGRVNLVVTVGGALFWDGRGMRWSLNIEKPRLLASGRKGKPDLPPLSVVDERFIQRHAALRAALDAPLRDG